MICLFLHIYFRISSLNDKPPIFHLILSPGKSLLRVESARTINENAWKAGQSYDDWLTAGTRGWTGNILPCRTDLQTKVQNGFNYPKLLFICRITSPLHSRFTYVVNLRFKKHHFLYNSSVESQKGVIAIQRCSVENKKGAIDVQSQWL